MSDFKFKIYDGEPVASPNFRTVARRSKMVLPAVMAIYYCLSDLENNGQYGISDDYLASLTDISVTEVMQIIAAMEGVLLDINV